MFVVEDNWHELMDICNILVQTTHFGVELSSDINIMD